MVSLLQAWNKLPAKGGGDIPAQLLPLLSHSQQQASRVLGKQASKKLSSTLKTTLKKKDPEDNGIVAACKQVITAVKYTIALVRYFCVPDDFRSTVLATGNETRYNLIAQLLMEASPQSSETACKETVEGLNEWCVGVSVPAQNTLPSANEEESEDIRNEDLQMNALALEEALLSVR